MKVPVLLLVFTISLIAACGCIQDNAAPPPYQATQPLTPLTSPVVNTSQSAGSLVEYIPPIGCTTQSSVQAGIQGDIPAGTALYSSPDMKFQVSYEKGLKVNETMNESGRVVKVGFEDPDHRFSEYIAMSGGLAPGLTLDEFNRAGMDALAEEGYTIADQSPTTLGGSPAIMNTITLSNISMKALTTVRGGNAYIIVLAARNDAYPPYAEVFDRMVQSFRFI